MGKTPSDRYIRVEQALGKNLRTWVRTRVKRRESWRDISLALRDATDINVSPETLRLWFRDLRQPDEPPNGNPEPVSA